MYYKDDKLQYNAGRSFEFERDDRNPCNINACEDHCSWGCPDHEFSWLRMTNTKAFLSAGVGINSWSGRIEVEFYESHDNRLAIESLSSGFWLNNMLAVCRTGTSLALPSPTTATKLEGSGFYWYVFTSQLLFMGTKQFNILIVVLTLSLES